MKIKNFISKINEVKEKESLDISVWEDLSIALMNLISLEEHSFFSYVKTHDDKFLKILEETRELRKKLFSLIVKRDDDSEKWCMSKHLLSSSMRLYEVGNRLLHENNLKQAKEMYDDAAELYGLFWSLNLEPNNTNSEKEEIIDEQKKKGIFESVKNFLSCCLE